MRLLVFSSSAGVVRVRWDGDSIWMCSDLTSDVFIPLTADLFRRDREKFVKMRLLLSKWAGLSGDERDVYLVLEFAKMGYKLVQKVDEDVEQNRGGS